MESGQSVCVPLYETLVRASSEFLRETESLRNAGLRRWREARRSPRPRPGRRPEIWMRPSPKAIAQEKLKNLCSSDGASGHSEPNSSGPERGDFTAICTNVDGTRYVSHHSAGRMWYGQRRPFTGSRLYRHLTHNIRGENVYTLRYMPENFGATDLSYFTHFYRRFLTDYENVLRREAGSYFVARKVIERYLELVDETVEDLILQASSGGKQQSPLSGLVPVLNDVEYGEWSHLILWVGEDIRNRDKRYRFRPDKPLVPRQTQSRKRPRLPPTRRCGISCYRALKPCSDATGIEVEIKQNKRPTPVQRLEEDVVRMHLEEGLTFCEITGLLPSKNTCEEVFKKYRHLLPEEESDDETPQRYTWPRKSCYIAPSRFVGYGLFAGETIYASETVGEYVGEVLTKREWERRGPVQDAICMNYLFEVSQTCFIDAQRYGNEVRFINHSSNPNVEAIIASTNPADPQILIRALRTIYPNDELLMDYSENYVMASQLMME